MITKIKTSEKIAGSNALYWLFPILILLLSGCTQPQAAAATETVVSETDASVSAATEAAAAETPELNVYAASSLAAPFSEIGELFEVKHPGVILVFNFAGSQQLARQITEGAPADVFASANQQQMDGVIAAGEVAAGALQTFAHNRLVVIYPKDNPADLKELKDLARPGLKLVFATQEVPVGQYALEFLDKASSTGTFGAAFKDGVLKNIVSYEDNVKAVLAKVALGEADAGIAYTSDLTGEDAGKVGRLDIPEALNVIAAYPIAPVTQGENPDLAQAFIDLVLAPEGQEILAKYGFVPVK